MTLAYIAKLSFITPKISIAVKKIDGITLETYNIASAKFLIQDNLEKI